MKEAVPYDLADNDQYLTELYRKRKRVSPIELEVQPK